MDEIEAFVAQEQRKPLDIFTQSQADEKVPTTCKAVDDFAVVWAEIYETWP